MAEKDIQWITVNGRHIPLHSGESKDEAVKKFFAKETNRKDEQIAKNKEIADSLNAERRTEEVKTTLRGTAPQQFKSDVTSAKSTRPDKDKWRVDDTSHTVDDYKTCKCYTSNGGSTIAISSDGNIISVCKRKGDLVSGKDLLRDAVIFGGKKLDSFEGNHDFYVKCGFEPISWIRFNADAMDDKTLSDWKKSGCGKEDVIFYKYVGVGNVRNSDLKKFKKSIAPFDGENCWDDAYTYRDKH